MNGVASHRMRPIDAVQFEVQTACVAHHFAAYIATPNGCGECAAIGAGHIFLIRTLVIIVVRLRILLNWLQRLETKVWFECLSTICRFASLVMRTFTSTLLDQACVSGLSLCTIFLLLFGILPSLPCSIAALLGHDCFLRPDDVLPASPVCWCDG